MRTVKATLNRAVTLARTVTVKRARGTAEAAAAPPPSSAAAAAAAAVAASDTAAAATAATAPTQPGVPAAANAQQTPALGGTARAAGTAPSTEECGAGPSPSWLVSLHTSLVGVEGGVSLGVQQVRCRTHAVG